MPWYVHEIKVDIAVVPVGKMVMQGTHAANVYWVSVHDMTLQNMTVQSHDHLRIPAELVNTTH